MSAMKISDAKEDRRLTRFTAICLALPEASRQMMGDHAAFLVGKKKFAYYLDNHHGDRIVGITCKVLPGDNAALITANPGKFYMPAYVGPRGWVALRLDVGEVDWEEVEELVTHSYQLVAPKRLRGLHS
jgi:predicted DNA-binding protein (MmcQ/YjbR family)